MYSHHLPSQLQLHACGHQQIMGPVLYADAYLVNMLHLFLSCRRFRKLLLPLQAVINVLCTYLARHLTRR
jgi:hypothetical protein